MRKLSSTGIFHWIIRQKQYTVDDVDSMEYSSSTSGIFQCQWNIPLVSLEYFFQHVQLKPWACVAMCCCMQPQISHSKYFLQVKVKNGHPLVFDDVHS